MSFDAQEFAARMRQLRARKNVTQQQVADATGLQQSSISNWEKGSSHGGPDYESAWILADYYQVPLAYLGGRTDFEPNMFPERAGEPILALGASV